MTLSLDERERCCSARGDRDGFELGLHGAALVVVELGGRVVLLLVGGRTDGGGGNQLGVFELLEREVLVVGFAHPLGEPLERCLLACATWTCDLRDALVMLI